MDREANLIPSSPSASSLSSSDLDTESTGSFFPDRNTSLGTLMGITFLDLPAGPAQDPSPGSPRGTRGGATGRGRAGGDSAPSSPMLQTPEHQVACHTAHGGGLGPLVDGAGLFYKPLQSDSRGANELSFYTSFSADPCVPGIIRRRFFPAFHGTQLLPASDASGPLPHLVLDDLVAATLLPSIIDIKIGSRTWPHTAPEDYINKCLKKDRETTSVSLGFRVSGLQIRNNDGFYRPGRELVKSYNTGDVRKVLRQFVSSNPSADQPDSALASAIYGGSEGVLAQLLELKAWFEDQTLYHFYSASVLVVYGREGVEEGRLKPRVKLVDFAHVVEGDGVIDHNFLGGLCSLIKFVSEILTDPDERSKKAATCFANGG